MKQIFVINGEPGCGKDTFVTLCKDIVESAAKDTGIVWNYSMVDKIKEIAKECGWNGEKTLRSRKFLSDLKDLCDDFCGTSRESVKAKIKEFNEDSNSRLLFIHAREPEDIIWLEEQFHAKSILVKRDNYRTETLNHADANVYEYDYDYVVKNPGTSLDDYILEADEFLTYTIRFFDPIYFEV